MGINTKGWKRWAVAAMTMGSSEVLRATVEQFPETDVLGLSDKGARMEQRRLDKDMRKRNKNHGYNVDRNSAAQSARIQKRAAAQRTVNGAGVVNTSLLATKKFGGIKL